MENERFFKRIFKGLAVWLLLVGVTFFGIISCSTENTPVYTLTASVTPAEAGTVSPNQGEFEEGEQVQVTASANEHWVFTGWGGDHSGSSNPATVMMDSDKSLNALFEKKQYELTVNIEGVGEVEERLMNAKSTDYPAESVVELTAVPAGGWEFIEWEGALSGDENPSDVTITSATEVTAIFEEVVHVTVEGEGNVEVEYIDDESEKKKGAARRVRLTATPQDGWKFVSWEGDLTGSENPIETTFDDDMVVDAVFISDEGKWVVVEPFTNKNITSIFFINDQKGWVTTIPDEINHIGGSIYHTNDGGESWTQQLKGDPFKEFFYDIEFADENNGWAIMQSYHYELINPDTDWHWYGAIMHTSDGGQTWNQQHFIERGIPFDLHVIDSNTAWVVGGDDINLPGPYNGIVLNTSNGGQSWDETSLPEIPDLEYAVILYNVEFAGNNIGWISDGLNGFKTTNGGNSWSSTSQSFSMDFVDNLYGFGLKDNGIYRTANQGDVWSKRGTVSEFIYAFDFVNSELGWIVTENGDILQTTDGAQTWELQNAYENGTMVDIPNGSIYNIHFGNSQSGWAGGESGYVLRYVPVGN